MTIPGQGNLRRTKMQLIENRSGCGLEEKRKWLMIQRCQFYSSYLKVPLGRKFIGLFRPNSVAEYRVLFIFPQKTEQQTFHSNIF